MSQIKTLKKGETLFKEGDKITHIHIIQSGGVNLCLQRPKKNIELSQANNSQVLGEMALAGVNNYPMTAITNSETKYLEIPVEDFKKELDNSEANLKLAFKSLVERLKTSSNEIKSFKMEKDTSPCPDDQVPRAFGAIYFTVLHKGTKNKEGGHEIDWSLLKQYSNRIFGESIKRLEQSINLLCKLKLAELIEGEDEVKKVKVIQAVKFTNISLIENFIEFYQHYYFKSGKTDILKLDDFIFLLLTAFLKFSEKIIADRYNIKTLDYAQLSDFLKNEYDIIMKTDYFSRLETKGIFCKRFQNDKGVFLQFEYRELQNTHFIWRFLKEIDKWNEKGYVDPNEPEELPTKKMAKPTSKCPACSGEILETHKFCPECGHKIVAAA